MNEFREIIIVMLLMFLGLVFLSDANAEERGCFPHYWQGLSSNVHQARRIGDVWHLYICDEVAHKVGLMGTARYPGMRVNQPVAVLQCGGARAKLWIMNCNDA